MAKRGSFQNSPPVDVKVPNSSGLITNARQGSPNGMDFKQPEVEQYFTEMQSNHWKDEDGFEGRQAMAMPFSEDGWQESMKTREMMERVEDARFLHRPVTGSGTKI